MLYDIHLELHYDYDAPVRNDRHLIRVTPISLAGVQRVIAAALDIDPRPDRQTSFTDFFLNPVHTIAYQGAHEHLDVKLSARVQVEEQALLEDLSPTVDRLQGELGRLWSLAPNSPHHFLGSSPRIALDHRITDYARDSLRRTPSSMAAAMDLCTTIYQDFTYDRGATSVETLPADAFALRRGVCQDFAQVMIAGLRGVGIPAGYVSGFLRTIPPPGKPRLEGADAMHAWVRAWCGEAAGWVEFDPTNAMMAGPDHITIGYGRDYADISPIVGVLRTSGTHRAKQAVDVVRVE